MKTKKKGDKYENKVKKELETLGWTVHRVYPSFMRTPKGFFTKSNDIFGCIDLVCKKKDRPTRWIQCTASMKNKSVKEKEILQYDFWGTSDQVEIWCLDKKKGQRVFRLCDGQFEELF